MTANYWETEHKSEGGGIIALCVISSAFKVYASGVSPTKSVFIFDESTKDAAAKKAKKLSEESGDAKIDKGVVIIARKDGAKVKGENADKWKDDQVFFVADWTDAWSKVVKPALIKLNLNPGENWLRIGFTDDPYGGKKLNQAGEEVAKQVAYPTKVYKNKAEAMADVKSNGNGNGSTVTDDDDTPTADDILAQYKSKIIKNLVERKKTAEEVAEGFKSVGVTLEMVQKVKAEL